MPQTAPPLLPTAITANTFDDAPPDPFTPSAHTPHIMTNPIPSPPPTIPTALPHPTAPTQRPSRNTAHPPNFWRGACINATPNLVPPSTITMSAVKRKLYLAQQAAIRNRNHRLQNPTLFNNRATDILPNPLPPHRAEMSIRKASQLYNATDISAGISKELCKHFTTYKSLTLLPRHAIEPNAVFMRSQIFIKKNQMAS